MKLLYSLMLATVSAGVAPESPNVLLLVVDDLRTQLDVPQYGHEWMHTPNIARLAEESTVFTRAYCQQALCAPSRNSFLTGKRPDTTLVYNFVDHFREPEVGLNWTALPELFKESGYTSVGVGKIYHPGLPPNNDEPNSWDPYYTYVYPKEGDSCPDDTSWCAIDASPENDTFVDSAVATRALELIGNVTGDGEGSDTPFFMAAGFRRPHLTWRFPEEVLDHYPEEDVKLAEYQTLPDGAPLLAYHQATIDLTDDFSDLSNYEMLPYQPFPAQQQVDMRRAYYSAVTLMDHQIGRVLDALEESGHADDTIVALWGDHGWQLGEWAEWEKHTNFEIAARVPLMIRVPWLEDAAETTDALVELVDIYPTIADLAGIDTTGLGLEGTSLASLLDGSQKAVKDVALTQHPRCLLDGNDEYQLTDCSDTNRTDFSHMGLSIRTENFRFTKWLAWDGDTLRPQWDNCSGVELYDHTGDDGLDYDAGFEALNRVDDPAYAAIVAELELVMRRAYDL